MQPTSSARVLRDHRRFSGPPGPARLFAGADCLGEGRIIKEGSRSSPGAGRRQQRAWCKRKPMHACAAAGNRRGLQHQGSGRARPEGYNRFDHSKSVLSNACRWPSQDCIRPATPRSRSREWSSWGLSPCAWRTSGAGSRRLDGRTAGRVSRPPSDAPGRCTQRRRGKRALQPLDPARERGNPPCVRAVREKDIRGMGRMLFPLARSIHLAPVANSRSANPSDIAAQHSRFRRRIRIHDSALSALHAAWEESRATAWWL